MGLSKSKSTQTNTPWGPAQPYILNGMKQTQRVFDSQQPELEKYGAMQRDSYGKLAPGAEAGIEGAQGLVNSTLNGDYLNGNPYTDGIIAQTNRDVTNGVNSQFEGSGRYGSGMHAGILARELASADNNLRYGNYAAERANQNNAVGQASGLMAGSQSLLNNAAELPWIGVNALNGNIRQASNGYGTQQTTQNQSLGSILGGVLGSGLAGWASGGFNTSGLRASDPRLKTNVVLVSTDPDGLHWYDFDYRQDMGENLSQERQHGVMADQVAKLRPWALGPLLNGKYMTVRYDNLGMREAV